MEILQQRLFTDEGQSVREIGPEPAEDGLVRGEAVELRGGCEDGASKRLVLHAQFVSPPWGMEEEGTSHFALFGSAISIKVCRGQMCKWFGSSKKAGSPPSAFGGPAGIFNSIYSCGIYSCW